ncbi:MAG: NADP-dependent oxidoreductase [Chitinophagaceae bacterium]|nr:NADP-dependent oxidoreductase [Chitinophagaceae bacterium]
MALLNKQVLLAQRPTGKIQSTDFKIVETPLPALADNEVLVKIAHISLDPAMRGWMNAGTTYIRGVEIGEVMRAFVAGTVAESKHPDFKEGDTVAGTMGAQAYAIVPGKYLTKVDATKVPLSWYVGILGMPGMTSYFGLLEKGLPKEGETLLVSGAAGMVGSLVGQIAKIKGLKVIGIAGGKEKCDSLITDYGFDAAIDYKNIDNIAKAIRAAAPNGIDIYFDNVGGEILDAALLNLANHARVVICGAISQYNETNYVGLKNYMKLISARGTLSGIIVLDYFDRAAECITQLSQWLASGKIKYKEHTEQGLDRFAEVLNMLFTGENKGKLVLNV